MRAFVAPAVLTLIACQGRSLETPPAALSAAAPLGEPAAARADADVGARVEIADEGDRDGWRETARYGFRLDEVKSCAVGPRPSSGRVWVGAKARVKTKDGALFVTARDFSLENDGMILPARHVDRPLLQRCLPLLPPSPLRAKQSVRGFVLFEMPVAWTRGRKPLVLAYRPTRWGGGQRIETRISPCLDECTDTPSTSRRSNNSRDAVHP